MDGNYTENHIAYSMIFCQRGGYNSELEILVIEKKKPLWMAGRYNLPGGQIEPGETPEQSAIRELYEEAGYNPVSVEYCGLLVNVGAPSKVYVFEANLAGVSQEARREGETEEIMWLPWWMLREDKRLMPNLKTIIPLCLARVVGWSIEDDHRKINDLHHMISVTHRADS